MKRTTRRDPPAKDEELAHKIITAAIVVKLGGLLVLFVVFAGPSVSVRAQDNPAVDKAAREARAKRAEEDAALKKIAAEHKARKEQVAKEAAVAAAKEEVAAPEKLDDEALGVKLRAKTTIKADKMPLKDFVEKLSEMHKLPITIDEAALKKSGVPLNAPVTVAITNVSLDQTLRHVLRDLGLHYTTKDGGLVVAGGNAPPAPVKAVRVARPAIAAVAVNDQQAQQFVQQYRPVVLAELHFIHKVCKTTPEQAKGLSQQADKALQTAATQYADLQRGVRRKVAGQPALSPYTEPHQLVRDVLAAAAKVQLSDEQMARLEEENERRRKEHIDTAVRNLVARLDQELILSEAQRDEIGEALRSHWQDAWFPSIEMWLVQDSAFPNVPNQYVSKSLTAAQKAVWSRMAKAQMGINMIGNFGIFRMMGNDEKLWDDDEPAGADEQK